MIIFLPFFPKPVLAEMTINAKGLPTPWPIGLISIFISIVGVFTYKSKRTSLGWIAKISFFITIVRSLAALLGTWINGSFYPVLASILTFNILFIWDSLYDWEKNKLYRETNQQDDIELTEISRESLNEIITRTPEVNKHCTNFKVWRGVFIALASISYIWQFTTLPWGVAAYNYNGQFITQCSEDPTRRALTIGTNRAVIVGECTPKANGFSCLLADGGIWICNPAVTFLSIILFCIGICFLLSKKGRGEKINACVDISLIIAINVLASIYLIWITIIQIHGLNAANLEEICDINPTLLSSKTGYVKEWWEDKLNTARHIALL